MIPVREIYESFREDNHPTLPAWDELLPGLRLALLKVGEASADYGYDQALGEVESAAQDALDRWLSALKNDSSLKIVERKRGAQP